MRARCFLPLCHLHCHIASTASAWRAGGGALFHPQQHLGISSRHRRNGQAAIEIAKIGVMAA